MSILRSAVKAWRGEEKLWVIFWGWVVLVDLIIFSFAITPRWDRVGYEENLEQDMLIKVLLWFVYAWQLVILSRGIKKNPSLFVQIFAAAAGLLITFTMFIFG